MRVAKPSGNAAMKSLASAARAAWAMAPRWHPGAVGNVLGHGTVSEERVLRDIADGAAQVLQVQAVDGLAVEQDATLLGLVKRSSSLTRVDLPEPVVPTKPWSYPLAASG